jgi:GWxTD domain-containing protein
MSTNPYQEYTKTFVVLLVGTVVVLFLSGTCRYYKLEQKLDPINKEWLSKVGYIITSEERKLFLEIPSSEKEQFKKDFWSRRDPDPKTEENEFKMEYEARIETANEIFISENRSGYLTDRGRIYVLFGSPMDRITTSALEAGTNQEIWYYGGFPVVFIDESNTGTYKLITYNLTSLRDFNLTYMHELDKAQTEAQKTTGCTHLGASGYL